MDFTPHLRVEKKTVHTILAVALCAMAALSLCIPLCTRNSERASSCISHPKLFPLYYQTNSDAPIGIQSSIGFPWFFRESQYRVNRPLVIGSAAGIRALAVPVLKVLLPKKAFAVMWGGQRAIDILSTYFIWIFLNIVFISCAALLLFNAFKPLFGSGVALVAALLLLSAPITLLSMREITEGSVQILLASASLFFWQRVIMERVTTPRLLVLSLGIGLLLLGKLAMTTFVAGALLCLFSRKRRFLGLIIPCVFLPLLCWISLLFFLGIHFTVNEINAYQPALSGAVFQSHLPRIHSFTLSWLAALSEDGLLVQLPFAVLGYYQLYKNGSRLLWMVPVFAGVDFCFFFALNRAHAVYGIHTMIFYFPAVAFGILTLSRWIVTKTRISTIKNNEPLVAALIVLVLQFLLIAGTIPGYGG
jgi:hypothetical protein